MYNTKKLRTALRELIAQGASGFPVAYAIDKKGEPRYIVFSLQELPAFDERNQIELEVNVVGPASELDAIESVSDAIVRLLDRNITILPEFAFYIYKNTRNYVEGSDPHSARVRFTFDLYIYERN